MAKNKDTTLNEFEIKEIQRRNEVLEKQIENLLIENKNLSKTIDFLKQEKPVRENSNGILITAGHSVYYKGTSYLPNQVIQNPPESDIDELLKFGELV